MRKIKMSTPALEKKWAQRLVTESEQFFTSHCIQGNDVGRKFRNRKGTWTIIGISQNKEVACKLEDTGEIFGLSTWDISKILYPEKHKAWIAEGKDQAIQKRIDSGKLRAISEIEAEQLAKDAKEKAEEAKTEKIRLKAEEKERKAQEKLDIAEAKAEAKAEAARIKVGEPSEAPAIPIDEEDDEDKIFSLDPEKSDEDDDDFEKVLDDDESLLDPDDMDFEDDEDEDEDDTVIDEDEDED